MISVLIGFSFSPIAVYVFGFELLSRDWWIFMSFGIVVYIAGLLNGRICFC